MNQASRRPLIVRKTKPKKIPAGKGLTGFVAAIAIMFLVAFVAILGYAAIFSLAQ
jgi:hypothetical protein